MFWSIPIPVHNIRVADAASDRYCISLFMVKLTFGNFCSFSFLRLRSLFLSGSFLLRLASAFFVRHDLILNLKLELTLRKIRKTPTDFTDLGLVMHLRNPKYGCKTTNGISNWKFCVVGYLIEGHI